MECPKTGRSNANEIVAQYGITHKGVEVVTVPREKVDREDTVQGFKPNRMKGDAL